MKSDKKKTSPKSSTKIAWEKLLNNKDSKKLLTSSWTTPNPQKTFSANVKKILKKHSDKNPNPKPKTRK